MAHITLYIPNGGPEEYDVESYGFNEGRLHFTVDGVSVATTVPYLIRQASKGTKAVVTARGPRSTNNVTGY